MRGIWRLPASADSAPDYPCGGMPGARTTLDASRRYLAVAHGNRDEQGVCVVDLARPGRVLFRRAFDEGLMRGLSFSPDGKALLTASSIGRTHVIDLEEGAIRMSLPADGPLGRPFNNAVFDAAGERIAIAAVDERVRLYRTDGTPVDELAESPVGERSYRVHRTAVRDVAFAPDGAFLVAVDDAGQVVRWSLDGSRQAVVLGNHDLSVGSVAIEPAAAKTGASEPAAETLVLTGSLDRTARLWGLETGTAVAVLGHDGALSEARFSRDGTRVFSFSERDGTVRLWSVQPVSSLAFELRHPDHVWNLDMAAAPPDLAPDGEALLLATAGYDGGVRVWRYDRAVDAAAPEPLAVFREHSDRVRQVDLSPSGRRVASAGFDGASRVSDLLTNASCTVRIAKPNEGKVYNALFGSPPGSGAEWLLTTSDDADRPVRLFNPADCAPIATGDAFAHGGVEVQSAAVRMIADRTLVATGDGNGTLRLLEQDNGGRWHRRCEVRGGVGAIGSIGLSADGTLIGVAGEASRAAVIDYDGRQCAAPRFLAGHTGRVYSIDVSPDGRQLLTASLDKTARTWFRDGRPWAVLVGHEDRIYHAAYSPGTAEWMLTASRDGSVRLWRRPTSRDGVVQRDTADGPVPRLSAFLPLRADLGGVASAAFSPDGNYIAGAYWDNAAMLWRLWSETPEVPRERQRRWGKERARLALVEEAYRFRADNRVTDPDERQTDAANAP
jgi:WD40 repeat protein